MKNAILICSLIVLFIAGCKKSNPGIVGRWNFSNQNTVYSNDSAGVTRTITNNYQGQSGDYYQFNTNGTVYTYINNILSPRPDTANYIERNDSIIVSSIISIASYQIQNLTTHSVSLYSVTKSVLSPNDTATTAVTVNLSR